jgi:hypothetical protein
MTPDNIEPAPALKPAHRIPRKKAQRLHGSVTVIRPEVPAATIVDSEEPVTPDAASQPLAVAASYPTALDSPDFADLEWPRYPKLLERIRALELEAARLRQREAAAAILWIKRAVRTYRIDASELALP